METYKIILVSITFICLLVVMNISKRITKKISVVKKLEPNRKKIVLNVFYFLYYLIFITIIIVILGINLEKLSTFISSAMAILGVAFFAQWSLLSNLTASIILFFYYPLKIGDRVKILDSDFNLTGKVKNITAFYVLIATDDKREITIPNSIVLQKGIEYLDLS